VAFFIWFLFAIFNMKIQNMKPTYLLCPFLFCFISYAAFPQSDMKPADTEVWEPEPIMVNPGDMPFASAPDDAIILFGGSNLHQWKKPSRDGSERAPADWIVKDDEITVRRGGGPIETEKSFGNVQLHIEWLSPAMENKSDQGYANSGIFFMGIYEIQVLNSFENRTYSNGQAGSIYKQHIPLVNASRKPGEWQTYDIIFTAPVFNQDGSLDRPATITAFHNGVLIQNNVELKGPTEYIGIPEYKTHPSKLPLQLQDHGDPVRYKNILIREL
jgi:hypothetical protein